MSIKDTITAARKEVRDGGGIPVGGAGSQRDDRSSGSKPGGGRRSAARAKPARDAATSVRVISADDARAGRSGRRPGEMTREERKAERQARRSEEDRRADAVMVLLKRQDAYRRGRRLYWILIGAGLALTIISFVITRALPIEAGSQNLPSIAAIVMLVMAYVMIIGAFVYDWRMIKPLRETANAEVGGLSRKRVQKILSEGVGDEGGGDERDGGHGARRAR